MIEPTAENLMRLIGDLNGRSGVDYALSDCWEFMPEEWRDLWDLAVKKARKLEPVPEPDEDEDEE